MHTPSAEHRGAPSHAIAEGGSGCSTSGAHDGTAASDPPLDAPELEAPLLEELLLLLLEELLLLLEPPLEDVDDAPGSPPPPLDPHAATNAIPNAER